MSSKSSFSKNCSFCCLFMIVVSAFVLLFAGLNYADSQNFVERQCVLTSVTYPTNTRLTTGHGQILSNVIVVVDVHRILVRV